MIKGHGIFSVMIILSILTTLSLDSVWILLGENCCLSLLGLKGLRRLLTTREISRLEFRGAHMSHINQKSD